MKILVIILTATIAHVFDYCPAPGQYTNVLPAYQTGDDAASMCAKAENCLKNGTQEVVSLGGWGGYIIFGFDHEVVNLKGEYDLKIFGNAFYAAANQTEEQGLKGSSEPGIVMVSRDVNGNGLPDDPWYELVGSEYHNPQTRPHYSMTYFRTDSNTHIATPDSTHRYLTDTSYIRWRDIDGKTGYMAKNAYHTQDYYPMWLPDSVTFTGTLLPPNSVNDSQSGSNYVSYCFDWGYVDNMPNQDDSRPTMHVSEFMLDWAVDDEGHFVELPGIHFVKVYTGTNQYNGWLGESSTEILDARDMHPSARTDDRVTATFENRPTGIYLTQPDSFWCGSSPLTSGYNEWTSGSYTFYTYNDDLYGSSYYYAFVVSNDTHSLSAGYWEPYRSTAGGARAGSNFAIWSSDYYGGNRLSCPSGPIPGLFVCNNAYTIHEVQYGGFSKVFDESDYLTLLCIGQKDGCVTDTVWVDLILQGSYIRDWTWVDLSPLGDVDTIELSMTGSDIGAYGLNTPAYVCLDDVGAACPVDYIAPERGNLFYTAVPKVELSADTPTKRIVHGELMIYHTGYWYDLMARKRTVDSRVSGKP